jgi:hypothetical protein
MKLKTKPSGKCILEFEEFYGIHLTETVDAVVALAKEYGSRRTAYNMWEFKTQDDAEKFIFLYRLKLQEPNDSQS